MNILVPIIFFVAEYVIIWLTFKFLLTKEVKPEIVASEASKEIKENIDDSNDKSLIEQTSDKKEEKSVVDKIAGLLLYRKYSWLISAILFSVLSIVAGLSVIAFEVSEINAVKIFLIYAGLSVVFLTDTKYFIIPNKVLLIIAAIRLLLLLFEYFIYSENFKNVLTDCAIGAIGCFVILAIISLASKGGIGMGDVKLFTTIGFTSGLYCTFNTLLYGLVVCAVFSLLLMLLKRKNSKDKVPFAPFIYIGYLVTLILGSF